MEGLIDSLKPLWDKYRIEIILISSGLILICLSSLLYHQYRSNSFVKESNPKLIKKTQLGRPPGKNILIDLAGAVERPDVYEVSSGARLKDLLILAGGLSYEADREFFSKNFNLALILDDQEKIYIPTRQETSQIDFNSGSFLQPNFTAADKTDLVSLNLASESDFDRLPGIGQVTAEKIIKGRPYGSKEDLLNKKIIGKNLFDKIKDLISL